MKNNNKIKQGNYKLIFADICPHFNTWEIYDIHVNIGFGCKMYEQNDLKSYKKYTPISLKHGFKMQ